MAPNQGDIAFAVELNRFLSRLLLILTETTFGAFTQEGDNFGFQLRVRERTQAVRAKEAWLP
jgi:hypothetical protein